jgi:hypothetical protein
MALKTGKKSSFSPQDRRHIFRPASTGKYSVSPTKRELGLVQYHITFLRLLHSNTYLKHRKKLRNFNLKKSHFEVRLKFARNHISWEDEWDDVVFSNEKKFNLDGSDGYQFYWYDLINEPQYFLKRAMGGGSLMVWIACSSKGISDPEFIHVSLDSDKYTHLLKSHLLS